MDPWVEWGETRVQKNLYAFRIYTDLTCFLLNFSHILGLNIGSEND